MLMQASLPNNIRAFRLKEVADNKTVYTVPQAMTTDKYGKLWLDERFSFEVRELGSNNLKVTKSGNWWIVDVSGCNNFEWSINEHANIEHANINLTDYAPVREIIGIRKNNSKLAYIITTDV